MKLAWIADSIIVKGFRELTTRMTSGIVDSSKASFPFGFASNPTPKFLAILAETQTKDEPVVIGYLDPRALDSLNLGDSVQYATDERGIKTATLFIRSDGTVEILGDADNAVRYSALETAFNELNDKFNTFANAYAPGGPATQGLPPTVLPSNADITGSKIDEIKVP